MGDTTGIGWWDHLDAEGYLLDEESQSYRRYAEGELAADGEERAADELYHPQFAAEDLDKEAEAG